MSSWCENVISINHTDPMMLETFRAAFNENIVAQTFRPLEENENATDVWGTKSDLVQQHSLDPDEGFQSIWFYSEDSPPDELIKHLETDHGLSIHHEYHVPMRSMLVSIVLMRISLKNIQRQGMSYLN